MDRAGKRVEPLTDEELIVLFELAARGASPEEAQRRLRPRDRSTARRTYNVIREFERRSLRALDEATREGIAQAAKYGATSAMVARLFLNWRGWRNGEGQDGGEGRSQEPGAVATERHQAELRAEAVGIMDSLRRWSLASLESPDPVIRKTRQALRQHLRETAAEQPWAAYLAERQAFFDDGGALKRRLAQRQGDDRAGLPAEIDLTDWAAWLGDEAERLAVMPEGSIPGPGPFPRLSHPDPWRSYSIRPDFGRPGLAVACWGEAALTRGGVPEGAWTDVLRPRHEALVELAWRGWRGLRRRFARAEEAKLALEEAVADVALRDAIPGRCEYCPLRARGG